MKKICIILLMSTAILLSGCERIATANYSNGIPGFPPGHDLSSSQAKHA